MLADRAATCHNDTERNDKIYTGIHKKTNNFIYNLLNVSNNYVTILRVLGYIFRFIKNAQNLLHRGIGPLDSTEMKTSRNLHNKEGPRRAFWC